MYLEDEYELTASNCKLVLFGVKLFTLILIE